MSTLFVVSYVALWLLLLTVGVLLFLLYRHFGVMALGSLEGVQRDGLPIGAVAPEVAGTMVDEERMTWVPGRGRKGLLVFAAPNCGPCAAIIPALNRLATAKNGHNLAVTAVVAGGPQETAELVKKFAVPFPCLAEAGSGAADRYRVRVTPFAFVIGEDGRILAKGLCSDAERLRDLLVAGGLDGAATVLDPPARLALRPSGSPVRTGEVSP
jgi:thiol-disulfide isomerase/thioredoxin